MAIGNMHKKFGEDRTSSSEDMIADRQTHTHTHTLITTFRFPIGGGVITKRVSGEGSAIGRVRPSVSFHSIF